MLSSQQGPEDFGGNNFGKEKEEEADHKKNDDEEEEEDVDPVRYGWVSMRRNRDGSHRVSVWIHRRVRRRVFFKVITKKDTSERGGGDGLAQPRQR